MVFVTGGSRKYLIRFVRSSMCVSTCVCIKALTKIHYSDRIRTGLSLKFPVYRETNGQIARCTCSMGDRKQELFGHQGELNHHVISSLKRVHDEIYRRFSRVHQYTTVHSVTGYSKLRGSVDQIQNERTQTLILCNARP